MADTLATINVEQLSSAVNAVVHAAESTQQTATTRQVQSVTAATNQVTASNVQLQVPITNLPVASNTVTIGNNAVPVMLVRVAGHQLSNQVHSLPVAVNQITNQVQAVPVGRTVAANGGGSGNVVGQIGNVAIALQPNKSMTVVPPAPVQTFTLPNINPTTTPTVGSLQGNSSTIATDLLNLTAAQNITFGNILSVQQKPSSDVLVLNPTNVQLNSNNAIANMASTALVAPSTSNTNSQVSNNSGQSPAINLNLNINLPTSSSNQSPQLQQHQVTGTTVQTVQAATTPEKSVTQSLVPKTTFQLPPTILQQLLQPVIPSGSMAPPSSVVNIPVAGLLSPNNVIQPQTSTSNVTLQMAPVLQTMPTVASSQSVNVSMTQPLTSQVPPLLTTQVTNSSIPHLPQTSQVTQVVSSQGSSMQPMNTHMSQVSHPLTAQVAPLPVATHAMQQVNLPATSSLQSQFPLNATSQTKSGVIAQKEHVTTTSSQAEAISPSQDHATEAIAPHGSQNQFVQDIESLAAWPSLQITQSSTPATSTNPQNSGLKSTQDAQISSSATSLPLHMTCEESTTAQGSLPLTPVTPHLTSILSDLTHPATTSSDSVHRGTHLVASQFHHQASTHDQTNSLHLAPSDAANNIMPDPVSAASMVAGVSAEDMEGLDISIPPSLSGLSVTAADFLHDEIVTGVWCVDCQKYNNTTCTKHGPIVFIRDSLIESRAKQTLPKILAIKPSKIASKFVGVFANEAIQVRTQFGPLQGRIVSRVDKSVDADSPLIWRIYCEGNLSHYLDTTDERVSNWMMFVKLARTQKEQNLVAHQQGSSVYFTTLKEIESGEELYVWYCRDYTLWRGVPTKPEGTFACHLCPMQFTKLSQLKSHNKYTHANMSPRRWKCNMCVRAFTTQSKLNVHTLVHMGVRPHKCELCDKTFTDPSNLRQHRLIHTGLKKFVCTLCNKSFRQKAHLESHLVIHTGEKKLKCKYCDKMFARPNDVTQHMYKHTKEKEVHCDTCGRAFWRLGHLKKHQKLHTGERDFHCTRCAKSFVTKYHLNRHLQTCKGPKGIRKSSSSSNQIDQSISETGHTKPLRTSSSRGRPLRPKPPFMIEARPSRLRKKGSSSAPVIQESPTRVVPENGQIVGISDTTTATSTISTQPQINSSGSGDLVPNEACHSGQSVGTPAANTET